MPRVRYDGDAADLAAYSPYLTAGKEYPIKVSHSGSAGDIVADTGDVIFVLLDGLCCAHLPSQGVWTVIEETE